MALIYRHIRLDNGMPFYIGIGKNHSRAFSKSNRGKHWNSVVKKYGYEVEIMLDDIDWETAIKKEKEFISLYGRKDNNTGVLINKTDGGEGTLNYKHRQESKNKMSESKKILNLYGERNPNFGKKGKLSKLYGKVGFNLGKKLSEETKNKMRLSHLGIHKGEKHPNYGKIGELSKMYGRFGVLHPAFGKGGENHGNYGKKQSKELIEKRVHSLRKIVGKYNKNGELIESFKSIKEASKIMGCSDKNISDCCNGKQKTAMGYILKFL